VLGVAIWLAALYGLAVLASVGIPFAILYRIFRDDGDERGPDRH
jgi:hypothetical protein